MGELHLEILVDRMQREFGVVSTVGKPQVAYRETITRQVDSVEYRHIKQTGGSGQFAVVKVTLAPNPGKGYEFEDKISGGKIPREYIQPVNQGIQSALDNGVLAGYPTVDVKATLVDGQYHDVDSSEMAFKIAGQAVFRKAAEMAKPVLLEPIMAVEVVTPRGVHGRRDRRPVVAPWAHPRAWKPGATRRSCVPGAAVGDVRLLHRPTLAHPGPGHVHDAVRAVHGSAHEHRYRHHQAASAASDRPRSTTGPVGTMATHRYNYQVL